MADKYGTDCGVKGMKNYLHIEDKDNEAEMENNVLDESAVLMASENEKNDENDTVLAFCKENVSTDIEEEDVELYEAMLDDCVRIDTPIYNMCRNALIGLIGFSVRENKDEEFEDWIKDYQNGKSNFSPSQKINFAYMKNDFNNYLVQRRGVING